jgi:hypothetical protein
MGRRRSNNQRKVTQPEAVGAVDESRERAYKGKIRDSMDVFCRVF